MSETWIVEGPDGWSRETPANNETDAIWRATMHLGGTVASWVYQMKQAGYTARKKPVMVEVSLEDLEAVLDEWLYGDRPDVDRLKQQCVDAREGK